MKKGSIDNYTKQRGVIRDRRRCRQGSRNRSQWF